MDKTTEEHSDLNPKPLSNDPPEVDRKSPEVNTVQCTSSEVEDPYAYIEKNGFTSEKFKIVISGLPKYYGIGELRKLLNVKLGLKCNKVKCPGRSSRYVYACFRSEEDKCAAMEKLTHFKWKGAMLQTKTAEPAPDPFVKRKNEENDGKVNKKLKVETKEQQIEAIQNSTTPLWNVPYEEQLKKKWQDARGTLLSLGVKLVKANPELKEWIDAQKSLNDGLPCKLYDTRSLQDAIDKYRNKCEFTIGKDEITSERVIGFRLGTYASGSIGIAPVDTLKIIPEKMLKAVKLFEKFVRESKYEVFSPDTLKGYWKQLTVRLGAQTNQLMVIVGFDAQGLSDDELKTVKEEIKEFFVKKEGACLDINSLYFQNMKRRSKESNQHQLQFLHGETTIEEEMCGLRFKISPESFFQINTRCAEVLIDTVKELAMINKETTVLDVCCGTGTIGLCLAKDCKKVLGIEVIPGAVENAKRNAANNEIDNCQFFLGRADAILTSVAMKVKDDQLVAVVDPPRAGLHLKAIVMLRRAENLDRLVYLSCDSKSALQNFIDLGRAQSKTLFGQPFVPVAAVPVDMFPHTNHHELVIYFERLDIAKARVHDLLQEKNDMEANSSDKVESDET